MDVSQMLCLVATAALPKLKQQSTVTVPCSMPEDVAYVGESVVLKLYGAVR